MSPGAIGGIAGGVLGVLAIIVAGSIIVYRRKSKERSREHAAPPPREVVAAFPPAYDTTWQKPNRASGRLRYPDS